MKFKKKKKEHFKVRNSVNNFFSFWMISSFPLIVPSTFQQVADIIDRNQDNIITVGEIVVGFGEILDYRCMSSPILIFVHFRSPLSH